MTIANAKPDLLITGPIGTTTVNAASSAWHDYVSVEAKITAAIAYAVSIGAKYCYVPDSFLPYTASLVTFNPAVKMIREDGDLASWEVLAYGASWNGVAVDTVAVQAAVDGAGVTGGRVRLPAGTGLLDAIYVPSNVTISGEGLLWTICKMAAGATGDGMFLNKTYVTFAMGNIEHSWTPRETGIMLRDFSIDGNRLNVAGARYGVHFRPCQHIIVERIRVSNTGLQGVIVSGCIHVRIRDCQLAGTTNDPIHIVHTTNFSVIGCIIEGSGDSGIEVSSGDTRSDVPPVLYGGDGVIGYNEIIGPVTNYGILVRGRVDATQNPNNYPMKRVTVVGNQVSGCSVAGIALVENVIDATVSGNGSSNNASGIICALTGVAGIVRQHIVGNLCTLNTSAGISVSGFQDSDLIGNVMLANGSHGITGSMVSCSVLANVSRNNNTAAGTAYNFNLTATSSDVEIRGNDLTDRGSRTTTADVAVAASQTRIRFANNNIATQAAGFACGDLTVTLTDAATVAVDVGVGDTVYATLIATAGVGATRAIGVPSNPRPRQRLIVTFIQDATGGRALTWNAVFKNTWSDAGNTLNKRSTIAHIYDGANWNQDGAQTAYV